MIWVFLGVLLLVFKTICCIMQIQFFKFRFERLEILTDAVIPNSVHIVSIQ